MKALVTTHAQMFRTPDRAIWTNSVYGYDFFRRYLDVFEEVRLVTRMKDIEYDEIGKRIRVDGEGLEFFSLPFYHGPWEYITKLHKIQFSLASAVEGCDCAVLRIPDQVAFQLFSKIRKSKIPCAVEVVAHSWDLYAPGTIKTMVRPLLGVLWDNLQKKTCRSADGVAYVTEKYIQKRYPSNINNNEKDRFETFYTSADLNKAFFYKPRKANLFNKEVLNIVHVSGINNSAKGHRELLNALAEINKNGKVFKAIFVGGGTLLNHYKELSRKLDLTEQVTFAGHVSCSDDIADILKKSDIFILPTMTEGLSRAILEAMAAGLPCIATNVGGIPELLSERCLFRANDVNDLKLKILEISNDINLLEYESHKNFAKAVEDFSPEKVQEKRRCFYQKLKEKTVYNKFYMQ